MEEWRDVIGYEGIYQVSSYGNVRSLDKEVNCANASSRTVKGKLLSPYKNKGGYLRVGLWSNGKCKGAVIHRLVAEAFIPNPDELPIVDHVNGDRTDNNVSNLRWVTQEENLSNLWTHRRIAELEARVAELEAIING